MKHKIGTILLIFLLVLIFFKWGPAINFNSTTQTRGEPFIVSGEGKVYVTPDIAKITFGVQENGISLKTLQTNVNTKSKSLVDAMKKLGIDERDIKTVSYNVYPQYDYSTQNPKITGYQVSTNYEITIRNFDTINNAIVAGNGAGANIVGNVSFELNDKTQKEKLEEARKLAVAEAKEKAEGLSKAAGITLGKIINISENQNNNIRPLALPVSGGGVTEKSIAQPDIQPGQTEIDVAISLSYEIK